MVASVDVSHPIRVLHQDSDDRPFIVIWEVTRACELVCTHCRADAVHRRSPLELTTDEGRKLLDDIASFGRPRPIVVLTGGDPLERADLVSLVTYGTQAGLSMSLSPSVTSRLTPAILDELRAAGAKTVSLSLDGATAATHDAFRGVPGVFEATLAAASAVRASGLRLQLNTTVGAANVHELPALLQHALSLQASLWSVFFLVPTGRGAAMPALGAADTEEVLHWLHDVSPHLPIKATEAAHFRRLAIQRANVANPDAAFPVGPLRQVLRDETYRLLADREPRTVGPRPPLDVNAGRGFAFVDHHGAVYPSGFLPIVAGSVRERSFPEIYRGSEVLRALRQPDGFGGRCGRCEFRGVCGGSRSHAFAATGDPLAEDPTCVYEPPGALTVSGSRVG